VNGTSTRVWRSTAGGRSVARAMATVQATGLRTLPLVLPARFTVLDEPALALVAGPPALDVLAEVVDRLEPASAEAQRRPHAARPLRSSATTVTPRDVTTAGWSGTVGASAATPLTMVQPSVGVTAGRRALRPVPDGSSPPGSPAPHPPVAAGPGPALRARPAGPSSREIARAAYAGGTHNGEAPRDPPTGGSQPVTATPVMTPAEAGVPESSTSPTQAGGHRSVRVPLIGVEPGVSATGQASAALGELVARWQNSAVTEPTHVGTAIAPPFVPLTDLGVPAGSATAPRADGIVRGPGGTTPTGDVPTLDRVERALEELLRREVEQHGLEGGWR
jgi:hypothetical protein